MLKRGALVALLLAAASCNQPASQSEPGADAPQLEAPMPDMEPSRVFVPANEAATGTTGRLTMSIALRMPDAGEGAGDSQEVLTLSGETGVAVEAQITGAISPATQVQGQTLRALLALPVEEPQVLVYRVSNETKPGGRGLCGGDAASHVVVWEPVTPGQPDIKVLGLIGGAPGAAGARACPMLDYRRA
jgi:hypothetical protein